MNMNNQVMHGIIVLVRAYFTSRAGIFDISANFRCKFWRSILHMSNVENV